ncbi:MAG: cell division protein ZapE [Burkholderiales bacterium]
MNARTDIVMQGDGTQASFRGALEQAAAAHGYQLDDAQRSASTAFERLDKELKHRPSKGLLKLFSKPAPLRGIYLCGAVGRGKTFIMDAFFSYCAEPKKRRIHFHRFMNEAHAELKTLQGRPDPLRLIARRLAQDFRLLCLDEFHVTDIGDAMILSGLLSGLFSEGVALVTTSNDSPAQLYSNGLQRARFLRAIEIIETHLELVRLDGPADYRLRHLQKAGVYHTPLNDQTAEEMRLAFVEIAGSEGESGCELDVEERPLKAVRTGDGTAWFTFAELCETARGTADYIEIARRFHTVLVEGVPRFGPDAKEAMRRFTWLVDEFYDRRVNLVLSAQCGLDKLLEQQADLHGVARTQSRLTEMQTQEYLGQAHLA